MRFAALTLLIAAITVVNAHFEMAFPPPRGPFDEENEVNFCDNYVNAANRTEFPLSSGFVTLTSEHASWNLAILISTVQNPNSFDDFNSSTGEQFARNFASASGAGDFCIPLDLSRTGISGVADGANVTIQLVFNGGDGSLFQCSDLTLSSNFSIPSNISCSNSTGSGSTTSPASSTSTGNSGISEISATGFAGVFAFLVALVTA